MFGDDGVLTNCVDPSFPPMEYFETQEAQEPIGFDIDLVNAIGERLGVEVTHIPTEFTGLLPALDAGRCDVVASGIYLTAERLETFDAQPYYDTSVVLLTPADNTEIASPDDLSGKTVAVQAGTNYVNILNDLNARFQTEGKPLMEIQSYPKQTDAIQQLVVGRADATITQDTEAAFRETAQPGQFKIAYTYPDPGNLRHLLPARSRATGGGTGGDGRGHARRRHAGQDRGDLEPAGGRHELLDRNSQRDT